MSTYTLLDIQETSFQEPSSFINPALSTTSINTTKGKTLFEKYNFLKIAYLKLRNKNKIYKNRIEELEMGRNEARAQLKFANTEILRLRAELNEVNGKRTKNRTWVFMK